MYRALQKRGVNLPVPGSEKFVDDSNIAGYAKDAVYMLKAINVLSGRETGTVDPTATATRAETAKIICGIMDYVSNQQGTH